MSNQWKSFAREQKEGNVDSPVSGGKYVGIGTHLLRVDGVEELLTRNSDPYYKLSYSDKDGKLLTDRLFPVNMKDGKNSFKYTSLAYALLPEDGTSRFELFTSSTGIIPTTPSLLQSLVGLYVTAEVKQGYRGYTIEDDNGTYRLYDVFTKDYYNLEGGIPNEFENYKDAREAAKGQGLYAAGTDINKFEASLDHVATNAEVLKELLSNKSI
jgi:hypothetical protein